jgi:hypothetical protein
LKVIVPAAGLVAGFLAGHGIETPPDLFLLLGTILIAYVSVGAIEAHGSAPSRPEASRRQRLSTSHRA